MSHHFLKDMEKLHGEVENQVKAQKAKASDPFTSEASQATAVAVSRALTTFNGRVRKLIKAEKARGRNTRKGVASEGTEEAQRGVGQQD